MQLWGRARGWAQAPNDEKLQQRKVMKKVVYREKILKKKANFPNKKKEKLRETATSLCGRAFMSRKIDSSACLSIGLKN
jgi:hypothetical protein